MEFIALAALVLGGCGQKPLDPAHVGRIHFTDSSEQERMKEALTKTRIHFEVHYNERAEEELVYDSALQDEVRRVTNELFGAPPPIGRNIGLGSERRATFAEEMRKRGASFRIGTYHGSEYVAWPAESDEAADSALRVVSVDEHMLTEMKRMRQLAGAEQRYRTNRSSRAREERAPAER
jgi:hypothetical protein